MTGKSVPPGDRVKEALTVGSLVTHALEVVRKTGFVRRKFCFGDPAKEAVRKLVQIPNCRSGTGRRAGPGTYKHMLANVFAGPCSWFPGSRAGASVPE